jgi:hypothetical protein
MPVAAASMVSRKILYINDAICDLRMRAILHELMKFLFLGRKKKKTACWIVLA